MAGFRNQQGIALLAVIFFLVVIGFVGIVFISLSSSNTSQALSEINSSRALYVAEGGLERAKGYLLKKDSPACTTCTCASINGNALFTAVFLGAGQFTVTSAASGNQCILTSTGGIPTIASGTAQRVASLIVGFQDGWAVGQSGGSPAQHPLTLHWDGSSWTAQNNASLNINRELQSVYCLNSSDCWAVGRPGGPPTQHPLTIHWNGSSWTLQDNTLLNINQRLNSVYCLIANDCWAVGRDNGGKPVIIRWGVPLANRWNNYAGSTPPGGGANLNSVFMNSSTDGWAVGDDPGTGRPIIFRWNGTWVDWSGTAPNVGANLKSVFMNSSTDGWAVGDDSGVTPGQPIMFRWNSPTPGIWNDWTPSAPPGGGANLNSVSMVSSTDGWAVGDDPGTGQPIMFRWNGNAWVDWSASAPNIGANLMSVSMVSSTDGWVVSDAGDMLHWDGANWVVDTQGTTASGGNRLNSVMIIGPVRPNIAWREVPQ